MMRICFQLRRHINTQIIKSGELLKQNEAKNSSPLAYPRTFQEKIIFVNDPHNITRYQVMEFGVKYRYGNYYFVAVLLGACVLFQFLKRLPLNVSDGYLMISANSSLKNASGYLVAPFMFENLMFYHLPLFLVVYQATRFIKMRYFFALSALNILVGSFIGAHLVEERVKKYQVWDKERICYGDANITSMALMFWSYLGFKDGFLGFKSKIFLKSQAGIGILRKGVPIAVILVSYLLSEIYLKIECDKKNTELMVLGIATALIFGRVARAGWLK